MKNLFLKKNKIRNTGVEITELSFGTSSLGSMPDTYGYEVSEQRALETLDRFFQGPVNMPVSYTHLTLPTSDLV